MKKKSIKVWIVLLCAPIASLFLVAFMQIIASFVFSSVEGSSTSPVFINIISLLVGTLAVLGILLTPLWIVMLVLAINHNKALDEKNSKTENNV